MYDFSFCVPSSEKTNPERMGHPGGLYFHWIPSNIFNKLRWETTLSEFNSPKDILQNSTQNNGSLVEEVWRHGWDLWTGTYQIPHAVREPRKHTHPPRMPHLLITLYHLHQTREAKSSLYPRPSEVRRRCRNISQNKTFITTWVFSSTHPGQGLAPSLPSLTHEHEIVIAVGHKPNIQT